MCQIRACAGEGDGTPFRDRWRRVLPRFPFPSRSTGEGSGLYTRSSEPPEAGPGGRTPGPHRPRASCAYLPSRLCASPVRVPAWSGRPQARGAAAGSGLGVPRRPARSPGPQPPAASPVALDFPSARPSPASPAAKARSARRETRPFRGSRPPGPPCGELCILAPSRRAASWGNLRTEQGFGGLSAAARSRSSKCAPSEAASGASSSRKPSWASSREPIPAPGVLLTGNHSASFPTRCLSIFAPPGEGKGGSDRLYFAQGRIAGTCQSQELPARSGLRAWHPCVHSPALRQLSSRAPCFLPLPSSHRPPQDGPWPEPRFPGSCPPLSFYIAARSLNSIAGILFSFKREEN